MFTWTSILTINGRPLTQNFTKITMEEVRAHAQVYQDRSLREAQNSEMLIQCLKASITRTVYNKIYLQREKYIILRKNTNEQNNSTHVRTRSGIVEIKFTPPSCNHSNHLITVILFIFTFYLYSLRFIRQLFISKFWLHRSFLRENTSLSTAIVVVVCPLSSLFRLSRTHALVDTIATRYFFLHP